MPTAKTLARKARITWSHAGQAPLPHRISAPARHEVLAATWLRPGCATVEPDRGRLSAP